MPKVLLLQVLDERVPPFSFRSYRIDATPVSEAVLDEARLRLGEIGRALDGLCILGRDETAGFIGHGEFFEILDPARHAWFLERYAGPGPGRPDIALPPFSEHGS